MRMDINFIREIIANAPRAMPVFSYKGATFVYREESGTARLLRSNIAGDCVICSERDLEVSEDGLLDFLNSVAFVGYYLNVT
jgi:hypothetical protein